MNSISGTQTSSSTKSEGNSSMSMESKYKDFIDQSLIKVMRNILFDFLSYMDTNTPQLNAMHNIVSIFRLFQIWGPSLCANFFLYSSSNNTKISLWNEGIPRSAVGILSILFHLIPTFVRQNCALIVSLVFMVVLLLTYMLWMLSSVYLKKTAKLPKILVIIINVLLSTVIILIPPIMLNLAGEIMGQLIMKDHRILGVFPFSGAIIILIISFLICLLNFMSIKVLLCVSLIFRPLSLQTILSGPQDNINLYAYVTTFLLGVSSQLSKIPQIVLMALCLIIYVSSIRIPFIGGTIINVLFRKCYLAAVISAILNLLLFIIYVGIGRQCSQIELFVSIGMCALSFMISHFSLNMFIHHNLITLDNILDDPSYIENVIESPRKLSVLVCIGFENAHPQIMNWDLISKATEKFPQSHELWILFGKFVSIYPEESNLLGYVIRNIVAHNLKGHTIKQMIAQANAVQMQRECSLTPLLKTKLSTLSKNVSHTKTKLRHIWDMVIQGSLNEMESAVSVGYRSVDKSRNEYMHAITSFPNNRFVARAYSRFLFEVMGDQEEFSKWRDKVNLLKNGVVIDNDLAHILGVNSFPNLPEKIRKNNGNFSSNSNIVAIGESEILAGLESEFNDTGENAQANIEQLKLIAEKIENLTIPSLSFTMLYTTFLFALIMVCVPIGVFLYARIFIDGNLIPLNYLFNVALMRNYNFMMPLWAHHYIMENIKKPSGIPVFTEPNLTGIDLGLAFGNFKTTRDQLTYIINQFSLAMEGLSAFHTYKKGDPTLKRAREIMYDPVVSYKYHINQSYSFDQVASLQSILVDNMVLMSDFLSPENLNNPKFFLSAFTKPYVLKSFMTAQDLAENITDVISLVSNHINEFSRFVQKMVVYIEIGCCILVGIIYIISCTVVLIKIKNDKETVYKCLMALPKNFVFAVSESLRILKKEGEVSSRTNDQDTESSKQEDAIMKLFASASDSSTSSSFDNTMIIFFFLIDMICGIVIIVLMCNLITSVSETLHVNTPHVNNVLGIATYMMGTEISLNDAVVGTYGYSPFAPRFTGLGGIPCSSLFERSYSYLVNFFNCYHAAKYGSNEGQVRPFLGLSSHIKDLEEGVMCPNKSAPVTTVRAATHCLPVDYQILVFQNFICKIKVPFEQFGPMTMETDGDIFSEIWVLVVRLYSEVFYPLFTKFVNTMGLLMDSEIDKSRPGIIILIVISFIVEIGIFLLCMSIKSKLKFTLNLLLHCNSSAVTSTAKILDVLGGNFSNKTKDMTLRDKLYYDSILKDMPDAIIVCDQQFKVLEYNKAFQRMFLDSPDNQQASTNNNKGQTVQKDLNHHIIKFDENDLRTLFNNENTFFKNDFSFQNSQECVLRYKQSDDSIVHLQTKSTLVGQTHFVTMSDISQTVSYNKLIKEERAKSDKLLASILPPILVSKVQAGQKNISFAVPSASIIFMDIVEFTPWCASSTAAIVMSTLNLLYKYFDANLSQGSTLTKIKCIGDCYMAAGGIFTELNQPAVHAKEAVEFGLTSIDSVNLLNKEKNEKLNIRVGINTGGPIVAGVLGTEKPTFEILGPAINMAQQMEHNGVPMQVHISRPVYELIYGGNMQIKERGQIQLKNGKAVTYLVESRGE